MDFNVIISKIPEILELAAQLLGALVVLATVVGQIMSKIFGKASAPEQIEAYDKKVFKVIGYLPTIGVNPRTKALEQAVKDIKAPK